MSSKKKGAIGASGKLSTKMAITITVASAIILTILTITSVVSSGKMVNKGVSGEMRELAANNAGQIQRMLTVAERACMSITDYHEKKYRTIGEQEDRYGSTVYDIAIADAAYDSEAYYANQILSAVKNNGIILGMGVFYEEYAFDPLVKEYAIYISEDKIEGATEKDLQYTDSYYSEEWYTEVRDNQKAVITKPFEFNGFKVVSLGLPLMHEGKFVGAVLADIKLDNFKKIKSDNANYPSVFAALVDANKQFLYHSLDASAVNVPLESRFKQKKEYDKVLDMMSKGEPFEEKVTAGSGKKYVGYFNPVKLRDTTWWAYTAVAQKDATKDVTFITIVLILVSLISLAVLVFITTRQIVSKLKPLEELSLAADALVAGNLDYEISYASDDEIGRACQELSVAFESLKTLVREVASWMNSLANKDFTNVPTKEFPGEFANIQESYRVVLKTINEGFQQIRTSVVQINAGADQVATGAQALSHGATEQAASIEELSATIANISEKIKQSTANANEANELTESIEENILESNNHMSNLMNSMDEITSASNEIKKIIKAIDDIAFQTNILALNAAVEAARAGQAGKGFAVVADEVRNLAGRSAEAAKTTTDLIEGAINAIEGGTRIAESTEESLKSVVENIKTVANKIKEISASSEEQSDAIVQINIGADQISSVVQTNSATSEQSAATSEEFAGQANMVSELVEQFKLLS